MQFKGGFAPRATSPLQGFMRLTAQTALAFPTALALMGEILLAYAPKDLRQIKGGFAHALRAFWASFFWQTIQKKPKNLAPKAQPALPVPCAAQAERRSLNSLALRHTLPQSALPSTRLTALQLRFFRLAPKTAKLALPTLLGCTFLRALKASKRIHLCCAR